MNTQWTNNKYTHGHCQYLSISPHRRSSIEWSLHYHCVQRHASDLGIHGWSCWLNWGTRVWWTYSHTTFQAQQMRCQTCLRQPQRALRVRVSWRYRRFGNHPFLTQTSLDIRKSQHAICPLTKHSSGSPLYSHITRCWPSVSIETHFIPHAEKYICIYTNKARSS